MADIGKTGILLVAQLQQGLNSHQEQEEKLIHMMLLFPQLKVLWKVALW
jgi:hypothetical protein